jgi:hypothetical protein
VFFLYCLEYRTDVFPEISAELHKCTKEVDRRKIGCQDKTDIKNKHKGNEREAEP